ncbi:MAG TPA: SH3 domain-containing protein [Anaeromyxobacteraceae bacterium]|nr:SH3 domain-containing protein [Anaeromyxobacteraceae bacterium]
MTSRRTGRALLLVGLLSAALASGACSRDGGAGKVDFSRGKAAQPVPDASARVVTAVSPIRREPVDAQKVKADGKGTPGAVVAVLHRGERVQLLEARDDWSRVRASGGQEGWMRASALVPEASVQEGTLLVPSLAFDRPDLLAMNAKRKLEPGTLLLVRASKDLFTEVDAGPGPATWILTDRISLQPSDVSAARLVEKARWLARNDRGAEARETLALLRSALPGSPLIPVLAVELGEAPPGALPADGPAAPSGPGAPAGLPAPSGPSPAASGARP